MLVPYADQQKVNFLSSSGDTLRILVESIQEFDGGSCAECCENKREEFLTIALNGPDSAFAYVALMASTMQIGFVLSDVYLGLAVDATGSVVCDSTLATPSRCLDSLIVQGKVYKNIYQLDSGPRVTTAATPIRIFYQAEKGLLRIERNNGEILEVL